MPDAVAIPDRRAHFRAIMARLDGSGDPWTAVHEGLYLPRPDGVAERIARSLEIRPNGRHLVVGTIGSGKTTALLRIQALLAQSAPECEVRYEDAGATPREDLLRALGKKLPWMYEGLSAWSAGEAPMLVLLDGLDRTSDLQAFQRMVKDGLSTFETFKKGLVCVGPPQLQAVPPSYDLDWFEQTHICGAVDPDSTDGERFLIQVVSMRGGDAFTPAARKRIARCSGGIVRDLLLLARQSLEDAYIAGDDIVSERFVDAAVHRLGRSILRATTKSELDGLRAETDDSGWYGGPPLAAGRLIVDRLLIPQGVPMRLRVHPCVMAFLGWGPS